MSLSYDAGKQRAVLSSFLMENCISILWFWTLSWE